MRGNWPFCGTRVGTW